MPARKVTPNTANRLTVTLDSEDRQALDRLAKQSDRSLAWIVRDALQRYLANSRAPEREKTR